MRRCIVLDPFCYKQFDPSSSAVYIPFDRTAFADRINDFWGKSPLRDGYAPFCKHLFIENFTEAVAGAMEITEENKSLLESGYEARNEKELPVLTRWFPKSRFGPQPPARFLDIILYSKAQIQEENAAMGNADPNQGLEYEYGVVGIKPQNEEFELPMQPITMFRNALGKAEGGSGHPLHQDKYREAVAYWASHALLK